MTKFIGVELAPFLISHPHLADEIKHYYSDASPKYFIGIMTVEEVQADWPGEDLGLPETNAEQWAEMLKITLGDELTNELSDILKNTPPVIIDVKF